jgi:hypothetical protein
VRSTQVDPALVSALKKVTLGMVAETLPERLLLGKKHDMAFDELLLLILSDEISRREGSST